jgi:hypothetical protein
MTRPLDHSWSYADPNNMTDHCQLTALKLSKPTIKQKNPVYNRVKIKMKNKQTLAHAYIILFKCDHVTITF